MIKSLPATHPVAKQLFGLMKAGKSEAIKTNLLKEEVSATQQMMMALTIEAICNQVANYGSGTLAERILDGQQRKIERYGKNANRLSEAQVDAIIRDYVEIVHRMAVA